jgi:hypothetical protein
MTPKIDKYANLVSQSSPDLCVGLDKYGNLKTTYSETKWRGRSFIVWIRTKLENKGLVGIKHRAVLEDFKKALQEKYGNNVTETVIRWMGYDVYRPKPLTVREIRMMIAKAEVITQETTGYQTVEDKIKSTDTFQLIKDLATSKKSSWIEALYRKLETNLRESAEAKIEQNKRFASPSQILEYIDSMPDVKEKEKSHLKQFIQLAQKLGCNTIVDQKMLIDMAHRFKNKLNAIQKLLAKGNFTFRSIANLVYPLIANVNKECKSKYGTSTVADKPAWRVLLSCYIASTPEEQNLVTIFDNASKSNIRAMFMKDVDDLNLKTHNYSMEDLEFANSSLSVIPEFITSVCDLIGKKIGKELPPPPQSELPTPLDIERGLAIAMKLLRNQ